METFMTIVWIVMFAAVLFFMWAAYRAIKKSLQGAADRMAKESKKQRVSDARMICEFMGYKVWKPWIARFKLFEHEMVTTPFGTSSFLELEEQFRSHWGWLHEVSNKIGAIPYAEKDGMREWMAIEWSDSKINIHSTKKEVYNKIIQFIEWYND